MRHKIVVSLCLGSALVLSACEQMTDEDVERAVSGVNVIDESNLNDIMLTVGDPNEAVSYFTRSLAQDPGRTDLRRGLAKSLIRARKPAEAVTVWSQIVASPDVTSEDRVGLADALIRAGDWTKARDALNQIPPTHETFDRYRLEAMVADANEDWARADTFYQTAVGLTTQPAGTLNNWGYSKLTRGDYAGAEKLFLEALTYDPKMFTAKNNLVMARGAQHKYDLPVVNMTQIERAQLLHTLALAAIKQGDLTMGKTLLHEAVETHPQHFDEAVRALRALEANGERLMSFAQSAAVSLWFLPLVTPIALWVVWSDMARMKIPNKAVMALVAVYAVLGPIALPLEDYLWRYAHLAVVLALGFLANMARLLGAGDAKFAAAMAPFIALPDAVPFLYLFAATLIAGFAAHRTARAIPAVRRLAPGWESWTRKDFPMGLCLGSALVIYLAATVLAGA